MTAAPRPRDWAPHVDERRPWRQSAPRGPRADREVREITVRRPPTIARRDLRLDRALKVTMDAALAGVGQLDQTHGRRLGALDQLLLRTESVASSKIENIEAGLGDYGRALHGGRAHASAVSMADATRALAGVVADAADSGSLRIEALLEAHRALFRRHPDLRERAGEVRAVQNWIGGSDHSPRGALFVPPPPEGVLDHLADLYVYANRVDVPVLVQAAVVHAQFESIHPFIDGNGRIGRTLIHAVLRRRRVTRRLTVPIASGLVAHRDRYFDALGEYREGHVRPLVAMLASATIIASHESRRTATNLHEIGQEWVEALGGVAAGSLEERLLQLLVAEPIVTIDLATRATGASHGELRPALDRLRAVGILACPRSRRRDRIWSATAILDELRDLTVRIEAVSRTETR